MYIHVCMYVYIYIYIYIYICPLIRSKIELTKDTKLYLDAKNKVQKFNSLKTKVIFYQTLPSLRKNAAFGSFLFLIYLSFN